MKKKQFIIWKKRVVKSLLVIILLFGMCVGSMIKNVSAATINQTISADDVNINDINFPDEIFRNWIKENLDLDKDDILTKIDIGSIKEIDIYGKDVVDLKGIEYFTNLEVLKCGGNWKVKKMDVSRNLQLKELQCSDIFLDSIDVSKNTKLEILSCRNIRLTTLDVRNLSSLKKLNCAENALTDLDVTQNKNLEVLTVYNNKLKDIDLANNLNLQTLRVDNNILTKLDVSTNKNLKELDCETNQLTCLDLNGNTNLTKVMFAVNRLVCLNLPVNQNINSGNENWYQTQTQTKIGNNSSFDLKSIAPFILESNITNVKGANIQGTILTDFKPRTLITYDYDCGSSKTIKVTLNVILADYSKVNQAVSKIPVDLGYYTLESVNNLNKAKNNVDYDKSIDEQDSVDGYAIAIENAIKNLIYKAADYTKVDQAIADIPRDLTSYTETSVKVLSEARNAVIRNKNITEQSIVDGYAIAIEKAIQSLELKPINKPSIIVGVDQIIKQGTAVTFTSNADIKDFIKVLMDGNEVSSKNYTLKAGSTIVTLNEEYTKTLSVGKHIISIVSTSGEAVVEFTITNAMNEEIDTPQTGDLTQFASWLLLFGLTSGLAMILLKRKQ